MNSFFRVFLLFHLLRWRLRWVKHDLDLVPHGLDRRRFISAREAGRMIADNTVVCSCGIAGNSRCSIFFLAIKDRFLRTGHPKNLTWITNSAQGGRGRQPATLEELGRPGLITHHITAHVETHKSLLRLVDQGLMDLHNLPQGVLARLYEAQARGENSVRSRSGLGTFLDPRVGTGTSITGISPLSYVKVAGDSLEYTIPKPTTCLFIVPYADSEGNLYVRDAACFNDAYEAAKAVRANGGKVIASVAKIIPKSPGEIFLTASDVDHIVVNPWNEQAATIRQRRFWKMFTVGASIDPTVEIQKIKFLNNVLRVTPRRTPFEYLLARLAAWKFAQIVPAGSLVNIGVGLPEEIARTLVESSHWEDLTFMTEAGAIGGLPAPGLFFGAALAPKRLVGSAEAFRILEEKLDITVLGMVEADELGNVNVSRRGPKAIDFVGVGGFCDVTNFARKIVFVGNWMKGGRMEIVADQLHIAETGSIKFKKQVSEVTFSGKEALKQGKEVYFVTQIGIFRLTTDGMELTHLMPGIDLQRDLLSVCPMRILPTDSSKLPIIPAWVITGQGIDIPKFAPRVPNQPLQYHGNTI